MDGRGAERAWRLENMGAALRGKERKRVSMGRGERGCGCGCGCGPDPCFTLERFKAIPNLCLHLRSVRRYFVCWVAAFSPRLQVFSFSLFLGNDIFSFLV